MRRRAAAFARLCGAAAAYTLAPYRVERRAGRWDLARAADAGRPSARDTRWNGTDVAWLPAGASDAAEAVAWRRDRAPLEFVHVHKCGGLTFSHVAPRFLCPRFDEIDACGGCAGPWGYRGHPKGPTTWDERNCGPPCCVVRPRDVSLYRWPSGGPGVLRASRGRRADAANVGGKRVLARVRARVVPP